MTDRDLLLSFIGSLTLADHMGDAAGDIETVLKMIGETDLAEFSDLDELGKLLDKRGVRTLYDTPVSSQSDDD